MLAEFYLQHLIVVESFDLLKYNIMSFGGLSVDVIQFCRLDFCVVSTPVRDSTFGFN